MCPFKWLFKEGVGIRNQFIHKRMVGLFFRVVLFLGDYGTVNVTVEAKYMYIIM